MGQLAEYSKVYERNPTTLLEFGDFSGGEVLTRPEETLAPNELSYAENWDVEEDGLKLAVREGLTLYADHGAAITSAYDWVAKSLVIYTTATKIYKWDTATAAGIELGTLTGSAAPVYVEWGDKGSEKLLVASGGLLQCYDGSTLTSVTPAGVSANVVFISNSRVVIAANGSHDTVWSAIGDHTSWVHDAEDASSAQTLPVGYKDGGNIIAMVPLSKDVVVFKDSGVIYRVIGSSPNWSVVEVARNSEVPNARSILALAGDVWYLDARDGIRSLATTAAYGDIGLAKEGKPVSSVLARLLSVDARIWHVRSKSQIWVRPNSGNLVYVYHYTVGCWTHYSFGSAPVDVSSRGSEAYVVMGDSIFTIGGSTDNGTAYIATVRPRVSLEPKPHVLVRFQVDYDPITEGNATATVGPVSLTLPSSDWDEDYAYSDIDVAFADDDPLVQEFRGSVMTRQVWRSTTFRPEIVVTTGRIRVRKIYLWVKGVSA